MEIAIRESCCIREAHCRHHFHYYIQQMRKKQIEYGDWQTSLPLAIAICQMLKQKGIKPQVLIEPTCGIGNFIIAALQTFDTIEEIYGIDINSEHIKQLTQSLSHIHLTKQINIHLYNQDIFMFDWQQIKDSIHNKHILVLGNPPWVTNSCLGRISGNNIPLKNNFKHQKGIEAITGKGNFDISESICYQLVDLLAMEEAHLVLILKNSIIKNIVYRSLPGRLPIAAMQQYNINAKKEFDVSVAAAVFCCKIAKENIKKEKCIAFDFYTQQELYRYGWLGHNFVANIDLYQSTKDIDGLSPIEWRSGVKHDCAKVMELTYNGQNYVNGYGNIVDIEEECIYPLLKSSDIGTEIITTTKHYIIITQKKPSQDTDYIKHQYPKLYTYLLHYAHLLDNRKSSIYKKHFRFGMFGIGDYSFTPYKVVISGLYKHTRCSLVMPINGRCVMLDDTCYALGFDNLENATTTNILNSPHVQSFLQSILFTDAKRVINKENLMRIDLLKAADIIFPHGAENIERYKDSLQKPKPLFLQLPIFT